MTLEVKLLDAKHFEDINKILRSHNAISGQDISEFNWERWNDFLRRKLDGDAEFDHFRVIGCFEEEQLKGFVLQQMGKFNPVWYMSMIAQVQTKWLGDGHGKYVNACLLNAIEYAEPLGHWDAMCAIPLKWARTAIRTQPRSPVWSRYELFVDGVIPANTVPQFGTHYVALGAPKPHACVIKKASLKMEYRLKYFEQNGYSPSLF